MKYIPFVFITLLNFIYSYAESPRSIIELEEGWKFHKGDISNVLSIDFDDSTWKTVNVPHDWAIAGPFDMTIDKQMVKVWEDGEEVERLRTGRTGALPMFGVGIYRKDIELPDSMKGNSVWLEFDGAMSHAEIFLNGKKVGERAYGYISFHVDVTDHFIFGKPNTLVVKLNNPEASSRWYSGAGLYRPVRLVSTSSTNLAYNGIVITTHNILDKSAEIKIKAKINNPAIYPNVILQAQIVNPDGTKSVVKSSRIAVDKKNGGTEIFSELQLKVPHPELWDIDSPKRYTLELSLVVDKKIIDKVATKFGFRTIEFNAQTGFWLNGRNMKMKGVCLHHDLGPIGAAVNYRATERQIEILKDMGCNAIRTSHNPASRELIELCDKIGMLVIEEAFDEWKSGKGKNGYAKNFSQWAERDLTDMIMRDINSPSVIMWSIGNEIREQNIPGGVEVAKYLNTIAKRTDPTRPTTAGFNAHVAAIRNGFADVVDVVGFNYKPHDYSTYHKSHPHYILYGSETASTLSSRGDYKFPAKPFQNAWYPDYKVSSYDFDYVRWGTTPDTEFAAQEDCAFSLGEFVWTGFDYLGEPTPYNAGTPARSSYFGIIDLAGLPKDRYYLYKSHWSDKPVLHILPHWNWEEYNVKTIPVMCYTNYPEVELFVNGKSLGKKRKDTSELYKRYRITWNVPYEAGEVKAIAYNSDGKAMEECVVKTAGKPYAIRLTPDRKQINADGKDLSYLTIEIVDRDGILCPHASSMVFLNIEGSGALKGLCNGDPTDQTSFISPYMRVYNGKLVATVISQKDNPGEMKITAISENLQESSVIINTK